ncbi:MAG: efflux RND transporter permease subunit [Gammaproteobacteria bacterium]
MNLASAAIKYKIFTLVLTVLVIVGGGKAYEKLGRLEDPEFTVKSALVLTQYPGASSVEVEQEVTEVLETAIQEMGQIDYLESQSQNGLSTITVNILDKYDKHTLPQVWDELRRKVNDAQMKLPPGVPTSIVFDAYGDVFGVLLAVTGEGYSEEELEDYADFLRRELLTVPNVAKVSLWGVQQRQVFVEISRAKMAQLGISLDSIYATLAKQNLVQAAGNVDVGSEYIRINPTGEISSVEAIGNLLIESKGQELIYLKDIAMVSRGLITPPTRHLRFNGQKGIAIGVSTISGGNVVQMGEGVQKRLKSLAAQTPLGIHIDPIYFQADGVKASVNGFVVNLIEALLIVLVVLMVFMGARSGLLIGAVLLITVAATVFVMEMYAIDLQRISLGALIIALGMLVDNAIVVVEGMQVKMQQGMAGVEAAEKTVAQTMWPLLGATAIAILAFAAIGLSQDSTGEYLKSLYQVMLISLGMSWLIAITVTPVLGVMFLKVGKDTNKDPYANQIFQTYKALLVFALGHPKQTLGAVLMLLLLSGVAFKQLEQSFFPNSTTPQLLVHYWLPQGTDIRKTSSDQKTIEGFIAQQKGVTSVSTFVGSGAPRYTLVYAPEKMNNSYGMFMVNVDDYRVLDALSETIIDYIRNHFVDANPRTEKIKLGPGGGYPLELRIRGSDPDVLRSLGDEVKKILLADGGAKGIRDNWRERVKLIRPEIKTVQAERAGLTRSDIAQAIETVFVGTQVGIYRERDKLLPIVSRSIPSERDNVDNLYSIQVWSDQAQKSVPLSQLVSDFTTGYEDAIVQRRNKVRTLTVQAEPLSGNVSVLFERVREQVESIVLPIGYQIEWGGEFEDSQKAQKSLATKLPPTIILMILITIGLFNAIRQPIIIWVTVPLSIIGVAFGLLMFGEPFGFMALLGFLSLSGMLIKNAIVLIDEMDLEVASGKKMNDAIVTASISRMRPVMMAAVTTVLGMIPLLTDVFFKGMAVTIMAGLTFATVLTLVVVPVLYQLIVQPKHS